MTVANMASNPNDSSVRVSIKIPEKLQGFITAIAIVAAMTIGLGISAVAFQELDKRPFAGVVRDYWKITGPLMGAFIVSVRWCWLRLWSKHERFVAKGNNEVKEMLARQSEEIKTEIRATKEDLSTRLEVVEGHTAATNGSVAKALAMANEAKTEAMETRHKLELFQADVHGWTRGKSDLPLGDN